jgi:hypothetical protein
MYIHKCLYMYIELLMNIIVCMYILNILKSISINNTDLRILQLLGKMYCGVSVYISQYPYTCIKNVYIHLYLSINIFMYM